MPTFDDPDISLLDECLKGNPGSLEKLIHNYQNKIFTLSHQFLWNIEDAEDATQEILVKVITKLSTFRKESKLSTWIYSISVNHLIDYRKSKQEDYKLKFEYIKNEIHNTQGIPKITDKEKAIYAPLVRTSCTYAMLLCLRRSYRLAFILGSIFHLKSEEAAWILQISAETFRKRLSRSRTRMNQFMTENCGLVKSSNLCRCENRIDYALSRNNLKSLLEASRSLQSTKEWRLAEESLDASEDLLEMEKVFRNNPKYPFRKRFINELKVLIESKKNSILEIN